MNESEENKELIQRMAETLRNHVELYREGAWERFSVQHGRPKPRILWWPYWSAAAVVLLAAGLFWFDWQSAGPDAIGIDNEIQQTASQRPVEIAPTTTAELPDEAEEPIQLASPPPRQNARIAAVDNVKPVYGAVSVQDTTPRQLASLGEEVSDDKRISSAAVDDQAAGDQALATPPQRLAVAGGQDIPERPAGQFPEQPNPEYATAVGGAASSSTRKWNLGVMVAPSLTSEKVNWGGGIAVAYQLSDKFSVGSGVSIGQLGVGENPNYEQRPLSSSATPNMPSYSDGGVGNGYQGFVTNTEQYREDVSVTSSVVTLDIPVDLRYEVARGFYTSVGVSYVAVLNEQRTSHFVGRLNERTFGESNSVHKDLNASTAVVSVSERTNEQPLEGKGYAGFMNFSIGRKVPLSKKLSLSVEPYFKLPFGRLSKEEMDFTNGGIRIVTGF